jgi:hypothetical protein
MISNISEFTDFQQALDSKEHPLPYIFTSIFNADSWGAKRLSKMKFNILKTLDPLLGKMLNENEQVFYISYGVQSVPLEQMFMGWMVYLLNRRVFIFTNKRILLIQVKGKFAPWDLLNQIPYENITKIKRSFATIRIIYTNGKSAVFSGMSGYDRKNIPLITEKIREKRGTPENTGPAGAEKLCPYCFTVINGFPSGCDTCKRPFKSAAKAGLLSLLFPGFGDFYLGHRYFALLEIIGTAIIWVIILSSAGESDEPMSLAERLILVVVFFTFAHGMDALLTFFTGRKGIYPAKHTPSRKTR